jgi:20S proteasome alpha/beta subunit
MCIINLQANAIGRSSKTVREFLEKNHKDDLTREESIKLTVKSLLEVVQTGAKNIEISVMESYGKVTVRHQSSWPISVYLTALYAP